MRALEKKEPQTQNKDRQGKPTVKNLHSGSCVAHALNSAPTTNQEPTEELPVRKQFRPTVPWMKRTLVFISMF